jgi:hypothetical protein
MLVACKEGLKSVFLGPGSLPKDAGTHWMYLIASLTLITLPFLLTCSGEPGEPISAGRLQLPTVCVSRLLGAQCPGCGATHSFVKIAQGNVRESFRWHRVGLLLYAYFVIQVGLRAYLLRKPEQRSNARLAIFQHCLSMTMIALLLGNWILALVIGSNGS